MFLFFKKITAILVNLELQIAVKFLAEDNNYFKVTAYNILNERGVMAHTGQLR